jgi:hypothetical protein
MSSSFDKRDKNYIDATILPLALSDTVIPIEEYIGLLAEKEQEGINIVRTSAYSMG